MNDEIRKKLVEVVDLLNQITILMKVTGNRWKNGSRKNEFFLKLEKSIFIVGFDESDMEDAFFYVQIMKIQGELVFSVKIRKTDLDNYEKISDLYNLIVEMTNHKDEKPLSDVFEELKKARVQLEHIQKENKDSPQNNKK